MKNKRLLLCFGFTIYLIEAALCIVASLMVGLWWLRGYDANSIGGATIGLLAFYAYIYESGVKKVLRQQGKELYFYLVFVVPCVFATLGYLFGWIRLYLFD